MVVLSYFNTESDIGQHSFPIYRKFVRFSLDMHISLRYNSNRTKVLLEVFDMTTFALIMVLLGAATVASSLMRFFDYLDHPRARRRHA